MTDDGRQRTEPCTRNGTGEDGIVIFYITDNGNRLAKKITKLFPGAEVVKFNSAVFTSKWDNTKKIICIMASGIVVRALSSLLENKKTDPAVVLLDEKGSYVISLLSGHIGGANELANKIADYLGSQAVITTASDVQGKIALDMWAAEKNLYIEDLEKLKRISAKIVNGKRVKLKVDGSFENTRIPGEFRLVDTVKEADVVISHRLFKMNALFMRPKVLSVGIGCNRGTKKKEINDFVDSVFQREKLSIHSIRNIATIDIKRNEKGLIEFARDNNLDIDFFTKEKLNDSASAYNIKESKTVKAVTGAVAVAEPAAVLGAKQLFDRVTLIMPKEKRGNVTLAIAKAEFML
jgi:cobalamin biosynthesis protein CbiG